MRHTILFDFGKVQKLYQDWELWNLRMHAGSAADSEALLSPGAEVPLSVAMEGGERLSVCLASGEF